MDTEYLVIIIINIVFIFIICFCYLGWKKIEEKISADFKKFGEIDYNLEKASDAWFGLLVKWCGIEIIVAILSIILILAYITYN